jgi:hypothetical protein
MVAGDQPLQRRQACALEHSAGTCASSIETLSSHTILSTTPCFLPLLTSTVSPRPAVSSLSGSTLLSATACCLARLSSDARHDRIEWNFAPRSPSPSRLVVFGLLLACVDPVALLRWLFTAIDRRGKTRSSRFVALAKEESQADLLL